MSRLGRRLNGFAMLAAPLLLVTGCSSGLAEPLGQSATEASAAVGSAALALRLETEGKATRALAQTTLGDMVDQSAAAYKSAAALTPNTPADLALQQNVLQNLDQALRSLHSAQLALETGDGSAFQAAVDQLQAQAAELAELGKELKP
jgi:methylphosphotriester-DNA--protein-cysteine methyltransferase